MFSEKMGLESGWNCHISLLNDCELPSGEAESISDNSDFKKINEALGKLGLFFFLIWF